MYGNEELKKIIIESVANHRTLDHKLHVIEAVTELFDKVDHHEQLVLNITKKWGIHVR